MWRQPSRLLRPAILALVLALHGLILWLVLRTNQLPKPASVAREHTVAAMLVSIDSPAPSSQSQPVVVPPLPPVAPAKTEERKFEKKETEPLPQRKDPAKAIQRLRAPQQTQPVVQPAAEPAAASTPEASSAPTRSAVPALAEAGPIQTTVQPGTDCPKPEYPKASRRLLEEGVVTLRILVGTDGHVLKAEISNTSGFNRLDEAARNALSLCQFRPGIVNGQPSQSWASINYAWRLK